MTTPADTHDRDLRDARIAELERRLAVLAADNERLARDNAELAREASEARLRGWVGERLPLAIPRMALANALEYARDYLPYVENALLDGRLELSNNCAERAIRPFVVGRKNFLFSNTPRGAEASAVLYSVTTTALANGLNPRLYVQWLLEEMPNRADLSDAAVDAMLPWSPSLPDAIRLSPAAAARAAAMPDEPLLDVDPALFDES